MYSKKIKIALLGAQRSQPECNHWKGIGIAMEKLDIDYYEIDLLYFNKEQVIKEVRDYQPDLLIYGLTDVFYQNYHKEIRECMKGKIAFLYADYVDDRNPNVLNIDLKDYIDYMFVSNDAQKEYWKQKIGIEPYFIPMAGTPIDKIQFDPKYNDDVVYIGFVPDDPSDERGIIIKQIIEKTPVTIINGHQTEERMNIYREMPKIYGSAKICLDISYTWEAEKYTSNRYYVIAGYGGFSLCKRFPGCEELYPTGIGKVYYDTVDEFLELKDYYLKHPEEREEIRMKGLKYSRKYHTYVNRIKDILKICKLLNE